MRPGDRTSIQLSICFVESAILFASGLDALCEKVVVVTAPEALRIERTLQRDYRGERTAENIAKVKQRIAAQAREDCPTTKALLRVENDGQKTIEQLADEVIRWAIS